MAISQTNIPEQVDHVAETYENLMRRHTGYRELLGAYWALHALLQNQKSYSRTLLISPILGAVRGEGRMFCRLLAR